MITLIWGTNPEANTFLWKMSAYPASETTPSWMRAPPESLIPTIGHPGIHSEVHDLADLLRVHLA